MFDSTGGGIHVSAVVGHPPEYRDWKTGDPMWSPLIHKTARIHALVTIDAGVQVCTTVGPRSLIMKGCHIGHDCIVGADVEMAPGAVLGGGVWVGDGAHIGINATVRPETSIGAGAVVGCGAVVLNDVPAGATVVGNPARVLVKELV